MLLKYRNVIEKDMISQGQSIEDIEKGYKMVKKTTEKTPRHKWISKGTRCTARASNY
jgi:hypothetical protein